MIPALTISRLFCKKEGSILSKAGKDEHIDTQAAVLAAICYEYVDFGCEALSNNQMQTLFLQHENALYVAKPLFNTLILCFICKNDANLGLCRAKIESLADAVTDGLSDLKEFLEEPASEQWTKIGTPIDW